MSRYQDFNTLKELTALKRTTDCDYGYNKFIQTGKLEFWDYGTGFLDVQVYVYDNADGSHVRIWFGTIDDGDFGGWRSTSSREKAKQIVDDIANNVFKDMISLPTKDELNALLLRYGIAVGYE